MNAPRALQQLGKLVELREREVDRLTNDLATQQAERERFLGNLERLEKLSSQASAVAPQGATPGTLSPALSLNSSGYKQIVLELARSHRLDLALHDANLERTKRLVTEAARRHQGLDQVVAHKRAALHRSQRVRDQKRLDEIATQMWLKGRG